MPSNRASRKIQEIKERINRHRSKLEVNGVIFSDPLENDPNLLGCSCNGCAFLLSNNKVAKITVDWDEVRLAQWIYLYQKSENIHPGLPFIDKVVFLEPGFFLIIREELDDIEFIDEFWYDEEIADNAYRLYSRFEEAQLRKEQPWKALFRNYKNDINELYEEVIEQAVHVGPDIVHPDDVNKVMQMQSITKWLLDHKILICDVISDNWGVREDGSVAIRDLGCNNAPILDVSFYLPFPPGI